MVIVVVVIVQLIFQIAHICGGAQRLFAHTHNFIGPKRVSNESNLLVVIYRIFICAHRLKWAYKTFTVCARTSVWLMKILAYSFIYIFFFSIIVSFNFARLSFFLSLSLSLNCARAIFFPFPLKPIWCVQWFRFGTVAISRCVRCIEFLYTVLLMLLLFLLLFLFWLFLGKNLMMKKRSFMIYKKKKLPLNGVFFISLCFYTAIMYLCCTCECARATDRPTVRPFFSVYGVIVSHFFCLNETQ